jgi:regulator of protease activity HflC (stomatin/prohibitin superfamily)
MAEIRRYAFARHARSERSSYLLRYRNGHMIRAGRGLALWFLPLATSLAEVPVDDRELAFMFRARSADYQDVSVQGVVTYRVASPELLSERIDFSIDLRRGRWLRQPLEQLGSLLTELAQELALGYVGAAAVRALLAEGPERIRSRIETGLRADEALTALGLEIVSVRVSAVRPDGDLERALELPVREAIQEAADEATFKRRAQAVEKERAIRENELQNEIELAVREERLIEQRGQNERRRATEEAEGRRIAAEGDAHRVRIGAEAEAQRVRLVEAAAVEGETARMRVYREMPPAILAAIAARELTGKIERIDHLNISPELLGPSLLKLIETGTERLGG